MSNRNRIIHAAVALIALALVSGCAETSREQATGKGTIRGINSIVTAPDINFLIEERNLGGIGFKEVAGFAPYDDLSYNFNYDIVLPGATSTTRLITQFIDVAADTEYTTVITGSVANPAILLWEAPEREWDGTETVFEADFVNLSPALGEVDIYFAPLGTVPVLGSALGTVGFGERIPYQEFSSDQYELIITPKDDPDPLNYLYQSRTLASTAGARVTLAIFDPDPSITAGVAVNLINSGGTSASLPDVNDLSRVRLFHAALGTDRVDGFFNSDFNNTIFPDLGFGETSAYVDIDTAPTTFTLTDAGNSGAVVYEEDIAIAANSKHSILLGGAPGAIVLKNLADEARALETFPVIRFTNMAVNSGVVNIYMLEPGTPITEDETPRYIALQGSADTGFFGITAGMHEITITSFGDIAPVSAPITIDVTNGDFVDIIILDTVDPTMADLFIFNSSLP
jgi:hypothetical protein